MTIAIWIIAICEIARLVQNTMQLHMGRMSLNITQSEISDRKTRDKEFFKALEELDKE